METVRCPGCIKMLKKEVKVGDKDIYIQIVGKPLYSQEVKWHKGCWERLNK